MNLVKQEHINVDTPFNSYDGDHKTVFDQPKLYEDIKDIYNRKIKALNKGISK